jgi:hypothetical protein
MPTSDASRLALLASVCVACGANVPSTPDTDATGTDPGTDTSVGSTMTTMSSVDTGDEPGNAIQLSVNRDVDVLFVIDNSGSMGEEQGRLVAGLPAFLEVLEDPAVAANYRIGVTTTDDGNPWCGATSPESGRLVLSSCRSHTGEFVFNGNPPADATASACTDVCSADMLEILPTTTEYDPQEAPRPWIERIDGATNVGGDLSPADALACALPQGIAGCGFESHLESMYKSFLRSATEDEEQYGFMRSSAVLSVVIVSDEVDCSANDTSIFLSAGEGGNQVFWSDPDAATPTSAVCWNAGVTCEGSGSPYDSCFAENKDVDGNSGVPDSEAVLHPISRYQDFLQELEGSKQQITPSQEVLMALITGVPQDYSGDITYSNSLDPTEQNDFGIGPGCVYDDGDPMTPVVTARPPVREREVAEYFEVGEQPNLYSICQETYANVLGAVASSIADQLRPACMLACVADTDPITQGVQPECTVIQESPGGVDEIVVPQCEGESLPADADVCYVALFGEAMSDECEAEGWNLEFRLVRRPGVPAPGGASVSADCQLSQNKQIDCPNLP